MMAQSNEAERAWALIEKERRFDRRLRWVSGSAWALTFVVLLVYGAGMASRMADIMRLVSFGIDRSGMIFQAALPLLAVIGVLSVLIATLTTIGIFLRMRTASLVEIQLRLSALERMLSAQSDDDAR